MLPDMKWWMWLAPIAACGGVQAPSSYADHDAVVAAQAKWCATIAELYGDAWRDGAACEAAYPAGSAPFLALMADCYVQQVSEIHEHRIGTEALRRACTDMVLESSDPGDISDNAVIRARCDRMERCQEVSRASCLGILEQLSSTQRSGLTSMYNLRAQAQVAECLDSTPCDRNEDKIHAACYDQVFAERVWEPGAR